MPQVVALGALDMVNFGPRETVPEKFAGRKFHIHNPSVTLMRTTPEECTARPADGASCGRERPGRADRAPAGRLGDRRRGSSFFDPEADAALLAGLRETLGPVGRGARVDTHVNDPAFAVAMAERLDEFLGGPR